MPELLTDDQLNAALTGLPGWTHRAGRLVSTIEAPTFLAGIRIVDTIAVIAEELDHHPDIDIRWTSVTFALSTHSAGGITDLDIQLARRISDVVEHAS